MIGEFEMTDLGLMSYFLVLEVKQCDDGIFISQEIYVNDLLKRFQLQNCNPVKTPINTNKKFSLDDGEEKVNAGDYRSLIGSLLYVTHNRPNIMHATSLLSRFMSSPSKIHFGAARRILRYLRGTSSYGIWYSNTNNLKLCTFSDSDWAGCIDDRKSATGYAFNLGSGVICWNSKKQPSAALSSLEAEYMVVTSAACQAIWLRQIMEDMKLTQVEATNIYCDNQSTIAMTKNLVHHSRTRHIETWHHFVRELVTQGAIKITYCNTNEQLADIFTKPLPLIKFQHLRNMLGIGIPRKFVRRYGSDLSSPAVLKVPSGEKWKGIPASVAREYFKKSGAVTLNTVDGKFWSVRYSYKEYSGNKLSPKLNYGWRKFATENHLDVGDVCVFELINRIEITLKVVIFQYIKDGNGNPSLGNSKQLKHEESLIHREFNPGNSAKALGAVEAAKKFTSVNPFFKVIIRPSYRRISVSVPLNLAAESTKHGMNKVILQVESRRWPVKLVRTYSEDFVYQGIPRKFVRRYGSDLSSPAVLKVLSGEKWKVELVKCDGEIWLKNGWQEFVEVCFLALGSFIIFEYEKNCLFNVIIIDKSALEIDYPFSITDGENGEPNLEQEFPEPEIGENENDVSILGHSFPSPKTKDKSPLQFPQPHKKMEVENPTENTNAQLPTGKFGGLSNEKKTLDGAVARRRPLTAEEKANAFHRASTNFKSGNPYFMVAMPPLFLHSLEYSGNKLSARITHGWREFARENHLEVGDVCVFELTNRIEIILKVVIFQHIKDANSSPSLGNNKQLKLEENLIHRLFNPGNSYSKALGGIEAAKKFTSVNPFFKEIIQPSYMKQSDNK
ncbi:hypothetical protein GH714_010529 [Hevea brasiliensis]|uniref:TF-B3 domain-containing protein n=1 Tax=Hevea brasiliensis TaxID=3981 RepID=A0A6A6N2Q9_HEVBR|nr:hypothetical protein GH714_010529 [Hevea brasiliensis]